MRVPLTASIICLLLLAACDGSSDSSPLWCNSIDRPLLWNVALSPESAVAGEGGGAVEVTVSVDYQETDEWIWRIIYHVYNGAEQLVTESYEETHLEGTGTYSFGISINTDAAQTYRVAVTLSDRCANNSHPIHTDFPVVQPAALGGTAGFSVARQGNLVYLFGGYDERGAETSSVLSYDTKSNQVNRLAPLPEARAHASVAMKDGNIYLLGGEAYGYARNTTYIYDSVRNRWTVGSPMTRPAVDAAVAVVNGSLQVDSEGHIACYRPDIDIWTEAACAAD